MKQTAVQWQFDQLSTENLLGLFTYDQMTRVMEIVEQAKEMEKEQIIKACDAGFDTANLFIEDMKYNSAEEYYEQTYGGNK